MTRLLALITTTTAWQSPQQLRQPTRLYRIKNSASVGAEAPVAPKIRYTQPDLSSATDTFSALARMCGVTSNVQDASLDFQGFALAFEQLYNDNVALEEGQLSELRRELSINSDDDPVSLHDWGPSMRPISNVAAWPPSYRCKRPKRQKKRTPKMPCDC